MLAVPNSPSKLYRLTDIRFIFAAVIAAAVAWLPLPARAQLGQWTPFDSLGQAVHMVLLPGDNQPYHSRVLWWSEIEGEGGEFGWKTGTAGCSSSPLTNFETPGWTWNPGAKIFCDGHALLGSGELLSVGGTEGFQSWGIRDARTYQAGTGSNPGAWSSRALMHQERFYPTATTLADGRVMVAGGVRSPQLWSFGGRRNGSAPATGTGDQLHRLPRCTNAAWDTVVTPDAASGTRPVPREGLTAVLFQLDGGSKYQAFFGGRNGNGQSVDDQGILWLLQRKDGATLGADYGYQWSQVAVSGTRPDPRSDHVALSSVTSNGSSVMAIYGGLSEAGGSPSVRSDFQRLFKDAFSNQWQWAAVTIDSGIGPQQRYGHASAYVSSTRKLYIFGGSGVAGADANDRYIHIFTFGDNSLASGSWSTLLVDSGGSSRRPMPRRDHTMVFAPDSTTSAGSLLLLGGVMPGGVPADTLWKLDLSGSTHTWAFIAPTIRPGSRKGHTAFYDPFAKRLVIFGGEATSGSTVDDFYYSIEPFAGTPVWSQGAQAAARLSGHTMLEDSQLKTHAQLPEIYNPATDTWTAQVNSAWLPAPSVLSRCRLKRSVAPLSA